MAQQLKDREFTGWSYFTLADAYLFTVTNWAQNVDLNLTDLEAIQSFMNRVRNRPAVIEALRPKA